MKVTKTKIFALLLAFIMTFALAACGGGGSNDSGGGNTQSGSNTGSGTGNSGTGGGNSTQSGGNEGDWMSEEEIDDKYMSFVGDTFLSKEFGVPRAQAGYWPSFNEYPVNFSPPDGYEITHLLIEISNDETFDDGAEERDYKFYFICADMNMEQAQVYLDSLDYSKFEWRGWEGEMSGQSGFTFGSDTIFLIYLYMRK